MHLAAARDFFRAAEQVWMLRQAGRLAGWLAGWLYSSCPCCGSGNRWIRGKWGQQ